MLASRISYVGELGWELYVPIEQGGRLGTRSGRPASRTAWCRSASACTARPGRLEKGYRAFGAELTADYNLGGGRHDPAHGQGAGVHRQGGLPGQRAGAAVRGAVHADRGRSPLRDGTLRYMLGGEPILTPGGERLVDAKGRPSYVTSAGSGPSVGKHLLMAYLPSSRAKGTQLAVEYLGEQYPVTVAVAGSTPLFDPENERVRS